ncbi:hypothetical protein [Xylophilus sp.]|uniref:hypothetical protein n=1 Tax=Xylophilus sp. TaxID=2653893 RepID=UPI0013BC8C2A|nr:hypothetical protein [Xylophilus sp.]KAF1050250.1 MAG: hypothetical protein GAK38_00276 [Xylophilus sp.]
MPPDIDDPNAFAGADDSPAAIHTALLWHDSGWRARIVKNEEDDGWAVEMHRDGGPEPALTGPWTMGRDKKNPKPLDAPAFHTLVKTASEVIRRHEQQLHARLHRQFDVTAADGARYTLALDIVPDENDPHAWLSATDASGAQVARERVRPDFRLTAAAGGAWVEGGFGRPG